MRIVQNEILEVDELALEPQTGAGVEVGPRDPSVADRASGETLVFGYSSPWTRS